VTDACALSRGQDPRLFVVGQHDGGHEPAQPSGQVVALPAPAPGAGNPDPRVRPDRQKPRRHLANPDVR